MAEENKTPQTTVADSDPKPMQPEQPRSDKKPKRHRRIVNVLCAVISVALIAAAATLTWTLGIVNFDNGAIEISLGYQLAKSPEEVAELFVQGVYDRDASTIARVYPPELQDKYRRDRAFRASLQEAVKNGIGASSPERIDLSLSSKTEMTADLLAAARRYAAGNATPLVMPSMSEISEGYIMSYNVTVDTVTSTENIPVVHTKHGWCISPDFAFYPEEG